MRAMHAVSLCLRLGSGAGSAIGGGGGGGGGGSAVMQLYGGSGVGIMEGRNPAQKIKIGERSGVRSTNNTQPDEHEWLLIFQ